MPGHVHALSDETHTFAAQARAMDGEGRKAIRVHDAVERNVTLVAVP